MILITAKPNETNWFSAFDPHKNVFIHSACWTNFVNCEDAYPIAFQVIENILQHMMFNDIEAAEALAHEPPIGCINDMCAWKPDVIYKLRTADICVECQHIIERKQIDLAIVKQSISILENLRCYLLFNASFHSDKDNDDCLPFTIAITKRKFRGTIEPLRRFLFLLDHFDSIIRTTVIVVGKLILDDRFDIFFREQNLMYHPSLGHWVKALSKLSRNNVATDFGLQDISDKLREVVRQSEEEKIVNARNDYRGHGYCSLHDNNYKSLVDTYTAVLESIEKTLLPILIRLKPIYIMNCNRIARDRFEISARILVGSHPDFAEEQIVFEPEEIPDIPVVNQVYMLTENKKLISLEPYIVYDNCPECHHNRVLISEGSLYLDPYIGHRVRLAVDAR